MTFKSFIAAVVSGVVASGITAGVAAQQKTQPPRVQPLAMDPQDVVRTMKLPPGFKATVFAAEPEVLQPIGFSIDHRGRLFVAENFSYPKWSEKGTDRITIFEDTDADGKHDKRTVFAEGFGYLTGVLAGHDGVWVANAPHLLFFPDRNHDDKPDGPPEIHLEGWNWKGVHNVINGLTWGPDGWIYGANGITVDSDVKVAGAPDSERVKLNCSIWRYHPEKKKFEVWCNGTTNPWGIDFNETGQLFFSTSVTPHFFHGIYGAHYQRMHGQGLYRYAYEFIKTHGDHLHWAGGEWQTSRNAVGAHGDAGGGHSHAGAMIYLGDQFPEQYRGTIFFNNIHGNRINNDAIARKGSGFVASHRPDFMLNADKWYRGITLTYGPDGSVYTLDWSDTDECHDLEAERETGRIYRIAYEADAKGTPVGDVSKLGDEELVKLQTSTNEFLVRHARQVLQGRGAKPEVHAQLRTLLGSPNNLHRLRALWTLHVAKGLDEATLLKQLKSDDEQMRAWAVQLLCEDKNPGAAAVEQFAAMAKEDPSAFVRLHLASALQRLPLEHRWTIAENLIAHEEDREDHNLPLMYWYGIEPLVQADKAGAVRLMGKTKIPKIREFITRRLAS